MRTIALILVFCCVCEGDEPHRKKAESDFRIGVRRHQESVDRYVRIMNEASEPFGIKTGRSSMVVNINKSEPIRATLRFKLITNYEALGKKRTIEFRASFYLDKNVVMPRVGESVWRMEGFSLKEKDIDDNSRIVSLNKEDLLSIDIDAPPVGEIQRLAFHQMLQIQLAIGGKWQGRSSREESLKVQKSSAAGAELAKRAMIFRAYVEDKFEKIEKDLYDGQSKVVAAGQMDAKVALKFRYYFKVSEPRLSLSEKDRSKGFVELKARVESTFDDAEATVIRFDKIKLGFDLTDENNWELTGFFLTNRGSRWPESTRLLTDRMIRERILKKPTANRMDVIVNEYLEFLRHESHPRVPK